MGRPTLWLIAMLCASAALPAVAAGPTQPRGTYRGKTKAGRSVAITANRHTLPLVTFGFRCGRTVGRVSFNDIALTRTSRGYRFREFIYGSITYRDNFNENGPFNISGRFGVRAREVSGRMRARPPRCPH